MISCRSVAGRKLRAVARNPMLQNLCLVLCLWLPMASVLSSFAVVHQAGKSVPGFLGLGGFLARCMSMFIGLCQSLLCSFVIPRLVKSSVSKTTISTNGISLEPKMQSRSQKSRCPRNLCQNIWVANPQFWNCGHLEILKTPTSRPVERFVGLFQEQIIWWTSGFR